MGIEPSLGNNQQVSEDDTGAFLQLDFNVDLAGLPVRGNVGARYVQTDVDGHRLQLRRWRAGEDHGRERLRQAAAVDQPRRGLRGRLPGAPGVLGGHDAPGTRQPGAVHDDQRLRQQPDRDLRQHLPRSVRGGRLRPVVRVVLRRGGAAVAGVLLQGHRHVRQHRARHASVHRQSVRTAGRARHRGLRHGARAARRPPTGCSRCRATRPAAT